MLRHPHRASGTADSGRSFLCRHPHNQSQHHNLTLFHWQLAQKPLNPLTRLGVKILLLGTPICRGLIWYICSGDRFVTGVHPMRVGNLVGGDSIDESNERLALVLIPGQSGDNRQANLLRHIVRGTESAIHEPHSSATVADDKWADLGQ